MHITVRGKQEGEKKMRLNIWKASDATAAAYKAGCEDTEKALAGLKNERDAALKQLRALGYELGEKPDIIHAARTVKKCCQERTSCDECPLNNRERGCAVANEQPAQWRIY